MMSRVLVTGKHGFIGSKLKGGKEYHGSILDRAKLLDQASGLEGILHLAAKSSRRICDDDPMECIDVNLRGLVNVLSVAHELDMWMIFASTYQVKEISLYGLSKLMGEELCRVYQVRGLKVKILRLPIVYGPGEDESKVVSRTINLIREGREPVIHTESKLNFAYVDDVANAIEHEVEVLGGRYGRASSFRDLVEGIKEYHASRRKEE